ITDKHNQTFLFITPETNKQYFIPKHVISDSEMRIRHREFNRKSIWPIYVNPPSKENYNRVSIVIATYGQIKLTLDCIDSLLKY
ncbi:hypothetical protein ACI4CU_28355, partial [Klebsiella pneumoniae]|uniref:hypothetical protein n=1 Tax=Klebsiella pneumoniae TaxID=573 RepID=UPI003853EEE7